VTVTQQCLLPQFHKVQAWTRFGASHRFFIVLSVSKGTPYMIEKNCGSDILFYG